MLTVAGALLLGDTYTIHPSISFPLTSRRKKRKKREKREGGREKRTFKLTRLRRGKTKGRKESERGQMGVSTRAEREGCTMGPPAERE
jgi:hypothetical protein